MSFSTPVTAPIFTKLTIMQYSLWTYPVLYFTQTRKNRRQQGQHFCYMSKKSTALTAVIVTVTEHKTHNSKPALHGNLIHFHLYQSRQTKCGYKSIFTIK